MTTTSLIKSAKRCGFFASATLACLIFSDSLSYAQAPEVSFGETVTIRKSEVAPQRVIPVGEGFFLYSYQSNRSKTPRSGLASMIGGPENALDDLKALTLYRYDADLTLAEEIEAEWSGDRDLFSINGVGGNLLWTYATPAGKERYAIRTDVLDASGKTVRTHDLMKLERAAYGRLESRSATSANNEYYTLATFEQSENRLLSKKDDERAKLSVATFSPEGELVASARKTLRVTRAQLDVQDVVVGEDGSAYVIARTYADGSRKESRGESESEIRVYALRPGAEELEVSELDLGGKYIKSLSVIPTPDGKATVVGLYSDKRDSDWSESKFAGTFFSEDALSGGALVHQPFTPEFLTSLGERATRGKNGDLEIKGSYEFLDNQRLADGTFAVLIEDYRYSAPKVSAAGRSSMGKYIIGDGILLTFDPTGELRSGLLIPKAQGSAGSLHPGLRMALLPTADGKVGVLYNDNVGNLTATSEDRVRATILKSSVAVVATAGTDGEVERTALFGVDDEDRQALMPRTGRRLSDGGMVFIAKRLKWLGKDEFALGRVQPGAVPATAGGR